MFTNACTKINKIWMELSLTTKNGIKENFLFLRVPKERFEEYLEFKMKYYVKKEITHRIAGIPNCKDAMKEYREILSRTLSEPGFENVMCCLDRNISNKPIVGISSMSLKTLEGIGNIESKSEINFKTASVKLSHKIVDEWNSLFPVPKLMASIGVDRYFEDWGLAIHPDYEDIGIATELLKTRQLICNEYGVRATGAWVTELASQKAAIRNGCETVFEMSYKELGKRLNLDFGNVAHTCKYMIWKA